MSGPDGPGTGRGSGPGAAGGEPGVRGEEQGARSDEGAQPIVGRRVEVDVGPVAHGGHCVARVGDEPGGRVLFVRHALPGERVVATVTEGRPKDAYWRADATEVLRASPDRVRPPCRWAGPGMCGGCDLQHVAVPAQRALKAAVVREQLARLAGLDVDVTVEAVPVPGRAAPDGADRAGPGAGAGPDDGLGWRTRVGFAVDASGRPGLRAHRSHHVVPVDRCLIASAGADAAGVPDLTWPGASAVDVVAPVPPDDAGTDDAGTDDAGTDDAGTDDAGTTGTTGTTGTSGHAADRPSGRLLVITPRPGATRRPRVPQVVPGDSVAVAPPPPAPRRGRSRPAPATEAALERVRGRTWVSEVVDGVPGLEPMTFRVTGTGFWQAHVAAAATLTAAVLDVLDPARGESALDLYSGSGLFTAALAQRVGATGSVTAVEGDARAVADARRSLRGADRVSLVHAPVSPATLAGLGSRGAPAEPAPDGAAPDGPTDPSAGPSDADDGARVDLVVLDPPRSGARADVVRAVAALAPRAVAYVACDPAALARDLATFGEAGYVLAGLRAFDLFPMTHHVECVAHLVPAG